MSRFRLFGILAAPLSAFALLSGCSTFNLNWNPFEGDAESHDAVASGVISVPARALVVGDEPFAVRAGSAVLAQGGSAADAATAIFFALSVTYPAAAGPGGGGICLVRDATNGLVEEFDFLPRAAARGGAYAVPGAVRGFFDMQKRFGNLPWQRDVAPAETLADAGFPISEALAARLAGTEGIIRLDAALAAEFLDESGQLKKAGVVVTNHAFAQTLGTIRETGADGFAQTIGTRLIAYAGTQGGALEMDDFTSSTTRQTRAATRAIGPLTVAFPAPGTGAGTLSAALLSRVGSASAATAGAVSLAAVRETLTSFGIASIPADLGSTGFAALDASGGAVSCAVTLNGSFGSGRTATDTGMQLAAAPSGNSGVAGAFLLPLIASSSDGVRFVGAGAGGPNGGAAITYALLRLAGGAALSSAGDVHTSGAAPKDMINLIACQGACVALPDPGGNGLGAAGDAVNAAATTP